MLSAAPGKQKPAGREPAVLPLLIRLYPKVRRDLSRFGQLDHVHRRRLASPSNAADLSTWRDVVRMACVRTSVLTSPANFRQPPGLFSLQYRIQLERLRRGSYSRPSVLP